ncbi:hypothetical protein [Macrococcus lamae]|uniref:Aminoglycoside phosphotransferase domain-containing protein n=1 Tax=Macrococcus lamae TaxID=198484 RepID=A0A4R6BWQ6_9STAP|nr:hypothetical protein [Macrococcus lamae]TDM12887.1 hypothetical protein ERX29_02480 [Macrococcus lamae]
MNKKLALKLLFNIGINEVYNEPLPISGGLLHKLYKVETNKGIFAIKVLNSEIMSRAEAENNYLLSELYSHAAKQAGINAVCAKLFNRKPWLFVDNHYYMVFD